jgi:SagB-type dehydrogenase family enzyme
MTSINEYREYLKSRFGDDRDLSETDQQKGLEPPPIQKPYPPDAVLVDLVKPEDFPICDISLLEAIGHRRSRRKYSAKTLSIMELSLLLWATQWIKKLFQRNNASLRTVPSGGARHPFETYLLINRVVELKAGLYRYLPVEHKLLWLSSREGLIDEVHQGCFEQYVVDSAVVFIWTVIPYRTEWRYSILSYKIIALDAGHLCQNLYLAAESIGAGVCALGAYDQKLLDQALRVDGKDEFVIYAATVGKLDGEE